MPSISKSTASLYTKSAIRNHMSDNSENPKELEIVNRTVDTYLSIFGNKWNLLILYRLFNGPKRFNELKRALDPITQTVLIRHLKSLQSYGIVEKRSIAGRTSSVVYCLSEQGYRVTPAMISMYEWIDELNAKDDDQ